MRARDSRARIGIHGWLSARDDAGHRRVLLWVATTTPASAALDPAVLSQLGSDDPDVRVAGGAQDQRQRRFARRVCYRRSPAKRWRSPTGAR